MPSYEECKEKAQNIAESYGTTVNKAYDIKGGYVFDTEVELMGITPVVIKADSGETAGLWRYINDNDLTVDDMVEREL